MDVEILSSIPPEWQSKKPLDSYDTQFLYVGFSRYNTVKQTLSKFVRDESTNVRYTETPLAESPLARCYSCEFAHVTVYSVSPHVWTEEADGVCLVFREKQAKQPA